MKYMCRSCKTTCNDMVQHISKVHKFSKAQIEKDLKQKPNGYKSIFEEIKWLRKNPKDIILVERLNRKDVKRIKRIRVNYTCENMR